MPYYLSLFKFLWTLPLLFAFSAVSADNTPAEAKFFAVVVDYQGNPVEGATVKGSFNDGKSQRNKRIERLTDENGRAEIHGMCWDFDIGVLIEKDGYYKTHEILNYRVPEYHDGYRKSEGRWEPYGREIIFVLKKRKSPMAMIVFQSLNVTLPELNKPYGYDMEYGSLVEPFGDGKVADFFLTATCEESHERQSRSFKISFPGKLDGASLHPLYRRSEFWSPYRALEKNVFEKELIFWTEYEMDGLKKTAIRIERLSKDQCLVLRTRTRTDDDGKLVSAHYGKIYGELRQGISPNQIDGFTAATFFNPFENDDNLECDGQIYSRLQKGKRPLNGHAR